MICAYKSLVKMLTTIVLLFFKRMLLTNGNCLIITNLPGNTSEMTLAANKLTHISTNNITTYNNKYTQMLV